MASEKNLVLTCKMRRLDDSCSFTNEQVSFSIRPGTCVWLRGHSGAGKTQTALHLMGLQPPPNGTAFELNWNSSIPVSERAGMLFQNGVLIDSLTVLENIELAIRASISTSSSKEDTAPLSKNTNRNVNREAVRFLDLVGLSLKDAAKMPEELSGGMLRRAALAQLMAQKKRLVLLDEPFTGLDIDTAMTVVKELKSVMKMQKTAFILISHQEHLCRHFDFSEEVMLHRRDTSGSTTSFGSGLQRTCGSSRVQFQVRTCDKIKDYLILSLPLIVLCFVAAGGAIAMLFGDSLFRADVTTQILNVMDQQANSWPPMMQMFLETAKKEVKKVADVYVPELKASLFCAGMAHLVVLEIAPLLTALLLAGRIGGSYAGEVGTMHATNQNRLLKTLGVSPLKWSLLPTICATLVAGPILTIISAFIALIVGGFAFIYYSLGTWEYYWQRINMVVLYPSEYWLNYEPAVLLYRSVVFQVLTILIAEICCRFNDHLQPRGVPFVITKTVVLSGVAIIVFDWIFSLILVRYGLATSGVYVEA